MDCGICEMFNGHLHVSPLCQIYLWQLVCVSQVRPRHHVMVFAFLSMKLMTPSMGITWWQCCYYKINVQL